MIIWNEEQQELRDTIYAMADTLNKDAGKDDDQAKFPRDKWETLARSGILGVAADEAFGGIAQDILTTMYLLEALGYTCEDAGLNFTVCTQIVSAQVPLRRYGTQQQQERYLPDLCEGRVISAHAITEPESGSDAFSMKTFARQEGSSFVLNGSKTFVTNGPIADLFVIYAVTDKDRGALGGISAFLVEKGTPGLTIGKPMDKMGLRTSPLCELFFDQCEIPQENLIGKTGKGFAIFELVMKWEILCSFAANIGEVQHLLERCLAYSKERKQFGQKIAQFQAISHKIANMKIGLESAKALLYHAGELFAHGQNCKMALAIAKTVTAEQYVSASLDAIQIFGAYGYMKEYEIEKYLRNSVAAKIYSGSSEIQRNVIASLLGL